jgi:hypothetical protein
MPRSGGGVATGSGSRGCANGFPRGVRGTPRSGGTLLIFFIIAPRLDRVYTPVGNYSRGQPICFARRSLRAELAKEEYATTWQEEEQGEPQKERVPRSEIHRRAQGKALDTLACTRVTQDKRTKERGSKGSGQTRHEADRHEPQGFADPPPHGSSCGSSSR